MTQSGQGTTRPRRRDGGALIRYRVMAYVTGTLLVLLVFLAVPLKYLAHRPLLATILGTAHGFLFMVYLVAAVELGLRRRWPWLRLGLVMVAGTVPFLAFYFERKVTADVPAERRVVAGSVDTD